MADPRLPFLALEDDALRDESEVRCLRPNNCARKSATSLRCRIAQT